MRALRFVDPALTITGATYRGVTGCPPTPGMLVRPISGMSL